jgi:hypothetical protein
MGGIFYSTNNGATWGTITNGIENYSLRDMLIDENDNIFVCSEYGDNGVFRSTNNGQSWTQINNGLGEKDCYALYKDHSENLLVGTREGVYKSSNNGDDWFNFNDGLIGISVFSLCEGADNILYAGTGGEGVYYLSDPSNDVENESNPKGFKLHSNFPNPFNPSTRIIYQIPEMSYVTLKVYDVLGNEIEILVNEEKATGSYELTWYAENLPSGVYFYQLQAGEFIQTKKMLLLK